MNAGAPNQQEIDSIIEAYLEALARGEEPNCDALLAEHSEHATELRQFFENYNRFKVLGEGATHQRTAQAEPE